MRILYLHQHFSLPAGSTATRSHAMARALTARGHAVTIACGGYRGAVTGLDGPFRRGARRGRVAGFEVVEFAIPYANAQGLAARALGFLRFALACLPLALSRRFDLIIASSTPLTVALPALAARRLRGTPFVFEIRDPWPESPRALAPDRHDLPWRLALRAMGWLADRACRAAAATIALTPGMAATALAHGAPAERIAVVPNGADLDLFGPQIAPWRPEAAEAWECLAVYAGTHGPANGLALLVEAARRLHAAGERRLRLVLVGEGAEKPGLMRAAAGLPNVTFLDPMPKPRLAGLLAGAQIGLHILAPVPALAEWAAPNKLMDCLAAGLPVVTNLRGSVAHLLAEGGCGLAVPPSDAEALAEALAGLAADPGQRQRLGLAARTLAVREWDRRRHAARFCAIIEAAGRGAPLPSAPAGGAPCSPAPDEAARLSPAPVSGASLSAKVPVPPPDPALAASGAPWPRSAGSPPPSAPSPGAPPTRVPSADTPPSRAPSADTPPSRAPSPGAPPSRAPSPGAPPTRAPTAGAPPSRVLSPGAPPTRAPSAGATA